MCVTEHVLPAAFSASLGARNGVAANAYTFELRTLSSKTGNYANDMITQCKKVGMQPVCDHPYYCKNDGNSVYLGLCALLAENGAPRVDFGGRFGSIFH